MPIFRWALLGAGFGVFALILGLLALSIQGRSSSPERGSASCNLSARDIGGFVDIPGGGFILGADPVYAEEGPPQRVFVSPFRLQTHEVTNGQFAAFVEATGYVTEAETNGGSALFVGGDTPEVLLSWWSLDPETTWRTPQGPGSTLDGLAMYPVIHITLNDARAYADWAGGRLPTEIEWEYAASLGLFEPNDPLSGMRGPEGEPRANVWSGLFPVIDTARDGFSGLAPVGCFEPGLTGVYDMIGNVWEWTETPFEPHLPRFTIKGGSFLCSDSYCQRYRAAAREDFETDFSTSHLGFRIVLDETSPGR